MDSQSRELERQGYVDQADANLKVRVLRNRMRAGEVTRDQVALLAYTGDPVAREALPLLGCTTEGLCGCGYHLDPESLDRDDHACLDRDDQTDRWASGLLPLLALGVEPWVDDTHHRTASGDISRRKVTWECGCVHGRVRAGEKVGWRQMLDVCDTCDGSGRRPPTPEEAHQWLAVTVALAVAREAHSETCWCLDKSYRQGLCDVPEALDAVEAWRRDPNASNENRCRESSPGSIRPEDQPIWLHHLLAMVAWDNDVKIRLPSCLEHAAQAGVDVRAATLEAVRPFCGGEA